MPIRSDAELESARTDVIQLQQKNANEAVERAGDMQRDRTKRPRTTD